MSKDLWKIDDPWKEDDLNDLMLRAKEQIALLFTNNPAALKILKEKY